MMTMAELNETRQRAREALSSIQPACRLSLAVWLEAQADLLEDAGRYAGAAELASLAALVKLDSLLKGHP